MKTSKFSDCTKDLIGRHIALVFAGGIAAVLASCASPVEQMQQRWADEVDQTRVDSLTAAAYTKAAAIIETWEVGDPARITACKITRVPSMHRNVPESIEFTCDGWVGPLSGESPFGCGTPVGRLRAGDGDEFVLGRHVFGYLQDETILIPRYVVTVQAQVIDGAEYETLKAQKEYVGRYPNYWKGYPMYWKDCTIRDIRKLDIPELDFTGTVAVERTVKPHEADAVAAELTHEWTTKERFERANRALETIPIGADRWDVLHALDGHFYTFNRGRDYAMMMDGFLLMHGNEFYTVEVTDEAVFRVWPFGYTEQHRQVPEVDLILRNDKVFKLIPHVPKDELASHFE